MLSLPAFRFAHEVYVLSPSQVTTDRLHHVNFFSPLHSSHDVKIIIGYMLAALVGIAVLTLLKFTRPVRAIGALLDRGGLWAPDFIRIVFGLSLIFSGLHNAIFGPELPLGMFGHAWLLRPALFILGAGITLGIFTRLLSVLAIILYAYTFTVKGWYMLTYLNYLGEALALVLVTYQSFSLDRLLYKLRGKKIKPDWLTKPELALPATRILFGSALLYAAVNIKILNPNVSLDVVNRYHLTKYFPFDPMLVVFGAALVEILIALLYMFGYLQRVNSLMFIGFIGLSLAYFKEAVWPHYLLFALAIGIFMDKPDKYALDRWLSGKKLKRKKTA